MGISSCAEGFHVGFVFPEKSIMYFNGLADSTSSGAMIFGLAKKLSMNCMVCDHIAELLFA